MLNWISSLLGLKKQRVASSESALLLGSPAPLNKKEGADAFERRINVERAFLRNDFSEVMPVADSQYMLDKNSALLRNTYDLLGLAKDDFEKYYLRTVVRFLDYVQLLPASEAHHHNGVGGLFRHSLEASNAAIRRATGVAFCGDLQGSARAKAKMRWPVAIAIAALTHDIGKAVYDIVVRSASGDKVWNPFDESLAEFGERHGGYRVAWNAKRTHKQHEVVGMAIIDQIVQIELRSWLSEGDANIIPAMLQAIGGYENINFPVVLEVVKEADRDSVVRYQARPSKQVESDDNVVDVVYVERDPASKLVNAPSTKAEDSNASSEAAEPKKRKSPAKKEKAEEVKPARVSSVASDKVLEVLPELFAQRRVVVNKRDRDRGIFWFDHERQEAWATYPAFFNLFCDVFDNDYQFSSYPKHAGSFLDIMEMAGVLQRTNGLDKTECTITIEAEKNKSMKLSMIRIADDSIIELLKRYREHDVEITNESLDIDVSESVMQPAKPKKKVEKADKVKANAESKEEVAEKTVEPKNENASKNSKENEKAKPNDGGKSDTAKPIKDSATDKKNKAESAAIPAALMNAPTGIKSAPVSGIGAGVTAKPKIEGKSKVEEQAQGVGNKEVSKPQAQKDKRQEKQPSQRADNKQTTPPKMEERSVSSADFVLYIERLQNNDYLSLAAPASFKDTNDGSGRDVVRAVMSAIICGRVDSESWGVSNNCLYITCSELKAKLGFSKQSALSSLAQEDCLLAKLENDELDVQTNGEALIKIDGTLVECIAFSESYTKLLCRAYEFSLDQLKAGSFVIPSANKVSKHKDVAKVEEPTKEIDSTSTNKSPAVASVEGAKTKPSQAVKQTSPKGKEQNKKPINKPKKKERGQEKSSGGIVIPSGISGIAKKQATSTPRAGAITKAAPSSIKNALSKQPPKISSKESTAENRPATNEVDTELLKKVGAPLMSENLSAIKNKDDKSVEAHSLELAEDEGAALAQIMQTLDVFISDNFKEFKDRITMPGKDKKEAQLAKEESNHSIHGTPIKVLVEAEYLCISGFPMIFKNRVCRTFKSMKEQFLSRITDSEKVVVVGSWYWFERAALPKTFKEKLEFDEIKEGVNE